MVFPLQRRRSPFGFAGAVCLVALATAPQAGTQASKSSSPRPNFAHDIAPIIYQNCATCHHSSQPGALCGTNAFPLLNYEDVKEHAGAIVAVTGSRLMPPWLPEPGYGDFVDDHRLSAPEIKLISDWVRNGAPQGPASEIHAAPQFTDGWQLGQPDLILKASRPLSLPATGPDIFWNFIFSPGLETARYVRAIEIRPGSDLSLVHHANLILDPAGSARGQEREPGAGFPGMDLTLESSPFDIPSHFLFWKPGGSPWVEPDGFAWQLNPGTDLVLNAHFMPIGTPQQAQPSIGLYFRDKPPTHFPMLIELENDDALDIPSGARDFVVGDDFRLPRDVDVLAVYPHAHYLGHLLEGYATLPDGQRKWLIRIPDWDPKWQAVYHYRKPVFLPKGTVVSMRYHYDNSTANPRNPNSPPRRVQGGNQSTDEMAHLWLQLLPRGADERGERVEIESALLQHRVGKYKDDFPSRLALGVLMLGRLDAAGAVVVLEQAARLEPKQEEARRFLGVALDSVGRSREAIEQFQIAVQLKPDDVQAHYGLGRVLVKSRRLNEAVDQFNAVLAIDPSMKSAARDRDLALQQLHEAH